MAVADLEPAPVDLDALVELVFKRVSTKIGSRRSLSSICISVGASFE